MFSIMDEKPICLRHSYIQASVIQEHKPFKRKCISEECWCCIIEKSETRETFEYYPTTNAITHNTYLPYIAIPEINCKFMIETGSCKIFIR